MVPQEIQQPIHLLTVVYQHDDNKVSGLDCQQFLSRQPCQAGQGISKNINFKLLQCYKAETYNTTTNFTSNSPILTQLLNGNGILIQRQLPVVRTHTLKCRWAEA